MYNYARTDAKHPEIDYGPFTAHFAPLLEAPHPMGAEAYPARPRRTPERLEPCPLSLAREGLCSTTYAITLNFVSDEETVT